MTTWRFRLSSSASFRCSRILLVASLKRSSSASFCLYKMMNKRLLNNSETLTK